MLKPLKAKINIEVEKTHYGFFSDVLHLANEHEPFKKWLDKNYPEFEVGDDFDTEVIKHWVENTQQPYEVFWSEVDDGIYLLDLLEREEGEKNDMVNEDTNEVWSIDKGKWISLE